MQSVDGFQLWCPSQSLWNLVTEHVSGSELPKIHAALGHSIVDMYKDVHTEAELRYKMWQESQQGNFGSRAGTPLPHQRGSPLADPPAVKELLRAEVKMLLQTLRERVSGVGRDREELLFQYKPELVDYALGHLDSCRRNCIDPGGVDKGSRPSSRCSVRSSGEDEIDSMRDKLNITDINQVVDRLRSVLMEDCGELKRLVKHLKANIKQQCPSEPTLTELRELRGAIEMDLELYPSSLAASPSRSSPLPLKDLKNRFRLSAGQRVPDETVQDLSTPPVPRPHQPLPLCQTKPRPPLSAPPHKTSASVKLINSPSLSRTQGQKRSTLAASGTRKIQTPICNRITASGHLDSHSTATLPLPGRDQIKDKTLRDCRASPEQDSAGFHHRSCVSTPGFQIETSSISPINDTHQSPHRSVHSSSRKCDLSPQTERKRSPAALRLGHINSIPSASLSDAATYSCNRADQSVSTKRNSKTQNGQQNQTSGASVVSATEERGANASESFPFSFTENDSVLSETKISPSQTGTRESNNRVNKSRNGDHRKDITYPGFKQLNKQYYTPPKRPLESTTSQSRNVQEAKTELIGKILQPVPPPRVST
ncbi:coiled-coil domain-containing protein 24 isoform X2 [Notolabrus celidotus]|nr:coiled-coil domain-containing protein 24 isoform X2 [Notolabrus celidotus]XP_034557943.1 coiled-coil domain-containing protein 24 isoform X2 [Notolabrus celidotus]